MAAHVGPGRPTRNATASHNRVVVLLDDDELAELKARAAKLGVSVGEYVRRKLREKGGK